MSLHVETSESPARTHEPSKRRNDGRKAKELLCPLCELACIHKQEPLFIRSDVGKSVYEPQESFAPIPQKYGRIVVSLVRTTDVDNRPESFVVDGNDHRYETLSRRKSLHIVHLDRSFLEWKIFTTKLQKQSFGFPSCLNSTHCELLSIYRFWWRGMARYPEWK